MEKKNCEKVTASLYKKQNKTHKPHQKKKPVKKTKNA